MLRSEEFSQLPGEAICGVVNIVHRFNHGRSVQNSLGPRTFKRAEAQFRTTSRIIYLNLTTITKFIMSKQRRRPSTGCSSRKESVRNFRALCFKYVLVRDKNEPFLSLKSMKIRRTLCGINACIKTRKKKNTNFRRARLRWRSECKSVMADFGASSFI